MANNNDIIKHSDIAESGAVKPLMEEFIALLNVLKEVDASVVKLAKDLKVTLKSTSPDSLGGINKLAGATEGANKAYDVRAKTLREQRMLESKLVETMEEATKVNVAYKVELENVNKANKENARLNSSTVSTYEKSVIQLNRMAKALKDLAILGKTNTTEFKNLKKSYDDLYGSVSNAEQMVGQFQRNVGNYASGFSPLRNSITQLTREIPAFANSFQTGFMAISNNVGALKDAISTLNAQNDILRAQGQKTVPVWRQLISAFLSWNTAISIGVTLLTVYGSKIGEWVSNLFSAESAINLTEKAVKRLAKVQEDAARNAVEENTKLTILLKTAQNVTLSYNERKKAVDELQSTYPNYFKNLREHDILAGNIADTELRLRDAILSKAKAQAATAAIVENETRRIELTQELRKLETDLVGARNAAATAEKRLNGESGRSLEIYMARADAAKSMVDSKINSIDAIKGQLKAIDTENKFLLESITKDQGKILTLENPDKVDKTALKEAEKAKKEAEKAYKEFLELEERTRRELEAYEAWLNDPSRAAKAGERMANEAKSQLANSVRVTFQDYRKAVDEGYKETREKDKKNQEKLAKEREKFLQDQLATLERFTQRENDIKSQQISDEINATQKRQDQLRDLAAKGSLDAQNSLALEERKRAELEAKRLRNLKAQKREELIFAGIKAYAANVEKNPQGAFLQTSKDLVKLTSLLSNLPSFKKGTENTGKVVGGIDGEGGMLSILHPEERVLTKEQNKLIGDFTNEELANLAFTARVGQVDDTLVFETRRVAKKIDKLAQAIENKPTQYFSVDEVEKLVHTTIETKHSKTTNTRRIGKYGF